MARTINSETCVTFRAIIQVVCESALRRITLLNLAQLLGSTSVKCFLASSKSLQNLQLPI